MAARLSSGLAAPHAPVARHDVFENSFINSEGDLVQETSFASVPDACIASEIQHPVPTGSIVYTANPQTSFLAARDQVREPDTTVYENLAVWDLCVLQQRGMYFLRL